MAPQRLLSARASKDGDKSWGEIIEDAAGVAKSVFNKIKDTASSILPSPTAAPQKPAPPPPKPEAPFGPGLGGGGGLLPSLLGRAVGSLLSSAVSSLTAQMQEAAKAQAGAYEEAVARLQGSAKLRARLGNVSAGPAMSQSSSSSSINGVVTRRLTLVLPVYGSTGSGTAQVSIVEGPQQPGGRTMSISVRTTDGAVIVVDDGPGDGGSGSRGSVIDVEYREIK